MRGVQWHKNMKGCGSVLVCGRAMQVVQRCARQTALERQDLSRTYLAHHELDSDSITLLFIS